MSGLSYGNNSDIENLIEVSKRNYQEGSAEADETRSQEQNGADSLENATFRTASNSTQRDDQHK